MIEDMDGLYQLDVRPGYKVFWQALDDLENIKFPFSFMFLFWLL
jgi:hypothetical protein